MAKAPEYPIAVEKEESTGYHGLKTITVIPLREGEDKQKMQDMRKMHDLITRLWNVYWIGQDAKKINECFQNASLIAFKFLGHATTLTILTNMDKVWAGYKENFPPTLLMKLSLHSKKMNQAEAAETDLIYNQLSKIYNKY